MRERPIIMSGGSVRAILEGRKTQTRRVVLVPWSKGIKSTPDQTVGYDVVGGKLMYDDNPWTEVSCPLGMPGDLLWVRETWFPTRYDYKEIGSRAYIKYAADGDYDPKRDCFGRPWRSPIHLPRWASRLTLRITAVRVERVQDVSMDDIHAEGIACSDCWAAGNPWKDFPHEAYCGCRSKFANAWDALNSKRGSNPYVWVITFEVVK